MISTKTLFIYIVHQKHQTESGRNSRLDSFLMGFSLLSMLEFLSREMETCEIINHPLCGQCRQLKKKARKNYRDLIKVYDRPDALLYLDPPYYGTEKYYQAQFGTGDHECLCSALKNVKGKFLLSYNDCEIIRKLYKDFRIEGIDRNNNLNSRYAGKDGRFKEVIIRNY